MRFLGLFVHVKNVNNAVLRLMLRNVLTASLELNFLYENIALFLNDNCKNTILHSLFLIAHKYAHRNSGAFSLDMSIYVGIYIVYILSWLKMNTFERQIGN